jgi:hypothetical protein
LSAHWASDPQAEAQWDAELALTEGLARLPDAPVPSNFTARVLAETERLAAQPPRASAGDGWSWWRRFRPAMAVAMAVVVTGLVVAEQQHTSRMARMARGVATISNAAAVPSPEVMRDFETIRRLGEARGSGRDLPDTELLALMR